MIFSEIAIRVLAAKECGYIRTLAQFWREYSNRSIFEQFILQHQEILQKVEELKAKFDAEKTVNTGFICAFDANFPCVNPKAKDSEKPYLIFYRGNENLLKDLNNNIAVIGLIDPTESIEVREKQIVEKIIDQDLVIVSGLAKGCDEIAHRICVKKKAKTIAILPTSLVKIAPASNRALANEIVETGGLLITEYYREPSSRNEAVGRYIERDRLQALFSKAIIMIASYKKGDGDSGSRHAMNYAEAFSINRYIMYNLDTDETDKRFGLNRELKKCGDVEILTPQKVENLKTLQNENLTQSLLDVPEQLRLV